MLTWEGRLGRPPGMVWCFFSSRRRHTRLQGDWSSDVCSSDLGIAADAWAADRGAAPRDMLSSRSEEHTSELQSPCNLVCRLLLEKKQRHHHRVTPCDSLVVPLRTHNTAALL